MSVSRSELVAWLDELKLAWESGNPERALRLFEATQEYYERPFAPGTTLEEYRGYWQDIVGLEDIKFDYKIVAIDGHVACVRWRNSFVADGESTLLDGVFIIEFDDMVRCRVFRQYWFAQ